MDVDIDAHIPNGGYGWVIVASVALVNMCNQSITSVFGLLFGGKLDSMNVSTSYVAFFANLNSLVLNFSGLFIGVAIKTFSARSVASVGCVFTSVGLLICSQATELWHFSLGYGFFVGMGLGMLAPSTFMVINSYFTTKRGRAVGVAMAGTGVGQMVAPHAVRSLLEKFGFEITTAVMGAVALFGIVGTIFFRSLPEKREPPPTLYNNIKEVKLLLEPDESDPKQNNIQIIPINTSNKAVSPSRSEKKDNRLCQKLVAAMDLELLTDPVFLSIIMGMGLVYTSTINFSMLFPYFLQHSAGISKHNTATCMSVVAGADIVSRLLLPHATDKLRVPYRMVFLFGTAGLLISRAAIAETTDFTNLIVLSAFTGITKSATVLNNNLVISAHFSKEKLPGAIGLNMITKGLLAISIGQLFGWIRDTTGSYTLCLHAQNVALGLVVLVWSAEGICKYFKK